MIVGQLAGSPAEKRGLFGLRDQVDVLASTESADAVAGYQAGAAAVSAQRVGGVVALKIIAGICRSGGLVETASRYVILGKRTIIGVQILLLVVVEDAHHVKAVFFQITEAPAGTHVLGRTAATGGRRLATEGQAAIGQGFFGDEVDHTTDGVGAVQRRGTVTQHFHAVDRSERDHVQVNGAAVGRTHTGQRIVGQTSAVEQHQRLVRTDAAHVGEGGASCSGSDRACAVVDRLAAGDALDHFLGGGHALFLQVVGAQDGNRHGGFGIDPADRRTGHFYTLQLGRGRHNRCAGGHGRAAGVCIDGVCRLGTAHAHGQCAEQGTWMTPDREGQWFEGATGKIHQHG